MASMSDVLASIPGYGGYLAKRQMNEQAGMQDLQQAGALQGILASVQQQQAALADRARNEALRAKIAALPPEQRTRENVLPILLEGAGSVKDIAAALPAAETKGQPIGSGGLRMPDGTVVPPAARPDAAMKAPPVRQRFDGENVIQEEMQADGTWKEVGRGPRFAKTVPPAAVPGEQGAKPPAGYRWKPDGSLEKIPGGPADKPEPAPKPEGLTPENAGKVAMSQQAVEGIGTTRGIIFDKEGNLNRGIVGAINLPIVSGLPNNSQARIARTAMRNAIEAKLRIETGAAATEPEVQRTLARFMPTVADTKESAKFKLDELEKFFKSSLSLTKGVKPMVDAKDDPLGIR